MNKNLADDLIFFGRFKSLPYSKFDNYHKQGAEFALYLFYDHLKTIIIIKNEIKRNKDIFFAKDYLSKKF